MILLLVLSSDTSADVFIILIGEHRAFMDVHDALCRVVYNQSKCFLHLKELPSKVRKFLSIYVARNAERILNKFIDVEIFVVKGKYKQHSIPILRVFNSKIEKYKVDEVIIASDFKKLIRNFHLKLKASKHIVIDDKLIPVQIADVLAYSYRRTRSKNIRKYAKVVLLR